jgi:branched-chain amino acid transport system permease protein
MNYVYSIVTIVGIFSILTLALNLQFGEGGIINFGLVAYFAVGAFAYAILTQPPPGELDEYAIGLELSPWLAAGIAVLAAAVFGVIVGGPVLRLEPEYLALATFAFAQVLESVFVNVRSLGNGTLGLSSIEPPAAASIPFDRYDLWFMVGVLVVAALTYLIVTRVSRSPFGDTLRAIRDDELAAEALGKRVERFRLKAFLLGCALAGVAGVLYTSYTTVAAPGLFTADVTFTAFIALVIGGLGSNLGALVGAVIFFGLQELLDLIPLSGETAQLITSLRIAVFGIVLILVLRFAPKGLMGIRRGRGTPKAVQA